MPLLLKSCFGVVGSSHKLNSCVWRSVFESVVSIWSGTADHERLEIFLTRRSKGRLGVPPVERNRKASRGGRGWFRENAVVISGGSFSWEFSRPLINYGEHDRKRRKPKREDGTPAVPSSLILYSIVIKRPSFPVARSGPSSLPASSGKPQGRSPWGHCCRNRAAPCTWGTGS